MFWISRWRSENDVRSGRGRNLRKFTFGNRLFNTNWVAAPASVDGFDGLGPLRCAAQVPGVPASPYTAPKKTNRTTGGET